MAIDAAFLKRLEAIDWFSNCGKPFQGILTMNFQTVSSWEAAARYYHAPAWASIRLEAQNVLTEYLSAHHHELYQGWNKIVLANKDLMQGFLMPRLLAVQQQFSLDQRFIACVTWDVLGAMMEENYRRHRLPTTFFRELLRVYEAGHFPCGWIGGEWPNGTLVIF